MYGYLNQAECELYCSRITSYSTSKKVGKYKTNLPFTKTAQKKLYSSDMTFGVAPAPGHISKKLSLSNFG